MVNDVGNEYYYTCRSQYHEFANMLKFFTSLFTKLFQIMLQLVSSKQHIITNLLRIYVKTTCGSTLCLELDPKWDISEVKKMVAPKMGLQPGELKVIFAGKELSDDVIIGNKTDINLLH